MIIPRAALAAVLSLLSASALAAPAAECTAASGERRVPLLELYTSEGCNSCPPTDRWVSELPARGYGPDRVVALSFHVDYWDRLGWIDPYGKARFSERQRLANNRNGARFVYTPQLMLNGKDYRRGVIRDDLGTRLEELNRASAKAAIRLTVMPAVDRFNVSGTWTASDGADAREAQGWIAIYENRLATDVKAGENRGKRLQHEFVVRDLAGPFPAGRFSHAFRVESGWKPADLAIAGFVQDARSGEMLQALALPTCRKSS
jgi:hypothetical protein